MSKPERVDYRCLYISFPAADEAFLRKRDAFIYSGDYTDDMFSPAKQFAAGQRIVIDALYLDISLEEAAAIPQQN